MGIKTQVNTCPGCDGRDQILKSASERVDQLERFIADMGVSVPEFVVRDEHSSEMLRVSTRGLKRLERTRYAALIKNVFPNYKRS